jgi:hypothetical protein
MRTKTAKFSVNTTCVDISKLGKACIFQSFAIGILIIITPTVKPYLLMHLSIVTPPPTLAKGGDMWGVFPLSTLYA